MRASTFAALSETLAELHVAAPDESIESLREENRLLRAVIDNFPGGLLLFDKDLKLVFCNERQKQLLEYPPSLFEYGPPSLEQIFRFNATRGEYGPGDIEQHVNERMQRAARREEHVFERTRPNGTVLEIRGVPLAGGGFVTAYLDVTQQRKDREFLAHMAGHDTLTGLANLAQLHERLQQNKLRVRHGEVAALHYIDLDHFKPVNDRFGRAAGDELLKAVADRLRSTVRSADMVARIGDDEFAVLQANVNRPSGIAKLAYRLVESIRKPYEIGEHTIDVGASIGIAISPRDGTDPDELIARAHDALYRAKEGNRGQFVGADPE